MLESASGGRGLPGPGGLGGSAWSRGVCMVPGGLPGPGGSAWSGGWSAWSGGCLPSLGGCLPGPWGVWHPSMH